LSEWKKLSIGALSQQLPFLLMLHRIPNSFKDRNYRDVRAGRAWPSRYLDITYSDSCLWLPILVLQEPPTPSLLRSTLCMNIPLFSILASFNANSRKAQGVKAHTSFLESLGQDVETHRRKRDRFGSAFDLQKII